MDELDYITLSIEQQQLITTEQAWHYHVIPKWAQDKKIEVYADEEKFNKELKDELEILLGKEVVVEKTSPSLIRKTLGFYYRKKNGYATAKHAEQYTKKSDDFLID